MRKYVLLLVVILAVAVVIGLSAIRSKDGGKTEVIKDQKVIAKSVVAFVRNPYKDDYDISRIVGYVENRGRGKLVRAHLEIQLLDKDGNKKELVKYDVTDVPPMSRRSFDANAGGLSGDRRAAAKITEIEVVK